jgi:hypothetical protein
MDITSILTIARNRRARVLEAQGKLKEAFAEYVTINCFERINGEHPSNPIKVI